MLGSKFNKVQIFVLSDMTVRSVQTVQHRADVGSMNKIRFFCPQTNFGEVENLEWNNLHLQLARSCLISNL